MDLLPTEPLSEVAFVHDYVQLGFQNERFSLLNRVRVGAPSRTSTQGEREFAGLLVGLIGQRVTQVSKSPAAMLELHFQDGSSVQILRGEEFASGAEAFIFTRDGGPIVVEHN
jgi:hypothetical protein